jgi:hypothetical protein
MKAQRVGFFHPARGYVRVKTGFSWPAFFAGGLWACAKGLWWPMLAMFVVDALIWFAGGVGAARGDVTLALGTFSIEIAYFVVRGRLANGLWRAQLAREGWRPTRRAVT